MGDQGVLPSQNLPPACPEGETEFHTLPGGAILEKPAKEDFFSFGFFFFWSFFSVGLGFLVCVNRFPWEMGAGETRTYFSTALRIWGGGVVVNSLRREPVEGRLTFDHISVGLFSTCVKEVGLSGSVQ